MIGLNENCRGCQTRVHLSKGEAEKIIAEYFDGNSALAEENIYQRRLKTCLTCEALEYGATCRFCGCFVEVRVRLADKHCPHPGNPRW